MSTRAPFQLLPDLSDDEFAQLKADIAARGVMVPIEYDEAGNVLDGHHRLRICAELGIERWPCQVREGFADDAAKRSHARSLNLARRHLNQAQRRELIADQLRDTPEQSNRTIGAALGVHHATVASTREELEGIGQIIQCSEIETKDGRKYPAKRAKLKSKFYSGEGPPRGTAFTGNNEWFTPPAFVDRARDAMRGIDLDPASHPHAQQWIAASEYFTAENDGLAHDWRGRVWMNPPYAAALIPLFVEKLVAEYRAGRVSEAVMLTHNNTDTGWFHAAAARRRRFVFPRDGSASSIPWAPAIVRLKGKSFAISAPNRVDFSTPFSASAFSGPMSMFSAFDLCRRVEAQGLALLRPFIEEEGKDTYWITAGGPLARLFQKEHGDLLFTARDDCAYSVEIKIQQKPGDRLALEYWSNRNLNDRESYRQRGNTLGWLHTCRADFLFYYVIGNDTLFILNLWRLQRWAFGCDGGKPHIYKYDLLPPRIPQPNRTLNYCVPVVDLVAADLVRICHPRNRDFWPEAVIARERAHK